MFSLTFSITQRDTDRQPGATWWSEGRRRARFPSMPRTNVRPPTA